MSMERNNQDGVAERDDIAIVGMACLFPQAPDLATYWHNITHKVDAIIAPPPEAWDAGVYYDPTSDRSDRVYCQRGGFLGDLATFDPLANGVMPAALDGSEPEQWLALRVARAALADAGYTDNIPYRDRTAIILGKGTYLNRGNLTAAQHGQVLDQTIAIMRTLHPEWDDAALLKLRAELQSTLPPFNTDTAPGLIPNVAVGRIANKLDLEGPSYTIDAACASSLVAIDIARRDLLSGRCDMALVGGMHVVTPVPVLMLFCQLGALSRNETIRPFDQAADGTLLSEGLGMIVLKRRSVAERDGDRIYATIKGTGVASDGRALSVLAPRVEGEERALRLAYEDAQIAPSTVELIEAHGTATLVGDATELDALGRVLGDRPGTLPRVALGTVKSMIGHTMPAAGIAGVIKTALALYHRTLPPTLGVAQPNERLGAAHSPFYLNTETRPWIHGLATPRRAGVNAFGFGGINAHVILEEHPVADAPTATTHDTLWSTELCLVRGADRSGVIEHGEQLLAALGARLDVALRDVAWTLSRTTGDACLAIVASSIADLEHKLTAALAKLRDSKQRKIKDRGGVYYADEPLARTGKVAFLFPGEGAQYPNMLADLCRFFPEVRAAFDTMDRVFGQHERGYLPSDWIFPRPAFSADANSEQLWQMDTAIEALVAANQGLYNLLTLLDIQPDAVVGHSTGEFSAMHATNMLDEHAFAGRILALNRTYAATMDDVPEATLLALGTGRADAEAIAIEAGGLLVAMDNCPHQVILAGEDAATDRAAALARARGIVAEALPFRRAYHTPLYERYAAGVRDVLLPWIVRAPRVPLYSCTTQAPFADDLPTIHQVAHEHWVAPVEFTHTIERMYDDGIRVFVEVGPKGNLSSFVDDTLRGRPALVVPANLERRSGIDQLHHMLGLLAAHGVPMNTAALYRRRSPRTLDLASTQPAKPPRQPMQLGTGWPPMTISDELAAHLRAQTAAPPTRSPIPTIQSPNGNGYAMPDQVSTLQAATATIMEPRTNGHHSPDQRDHAINAVPTPIPTAAPPLHVASVPSLPSAAAPPLHAASDVAAVMSAYLRTMDTFLQVQQAVMQTYLGAPVAPAAAPQMAQFAPPTLAFAPAPVPPPMIVQPAPIVVQPTAAPTMVVQPAPIAVSPDSTTSRIDTVVVTTTVEASSATPSAHDPEYVKQVLVQIVSDKTGYPPAMLDLTLDLEADLGIDSIKRIEILGAAQQQLGISGDATEGVASQRTLQGVIDALAQATTPTTALEERQPPFSQTLVEYEPEQRAVVRSRIDADAMPFLRDHTLGRGTSTSDDRAQGLAVMPFTMTMALIAEVAALLVPHQVVTGMRDVRAFRWLALDGASVDVEAHAVRDNNAVQVMLYEVGATNAPLAEARVVFGTNYPTAPPATVFDMGDATPPRWTAGHLYEKAMFHGPMFQGVQSLDRMGSNGAHATLAVLPRTGLFKHTSSPQFALDPVLLDQPGQVVGFWAAQQLAHAPLVFPFRLQALDLYGPPLAAGEHLGCAVQTSLRDGDVVDAMMEVTRADGGLYLRFTGWQDRRFEIPAALHQLLFEPDTSYLSAAHPLDAPNISVRVLPSTMFAPHFWTAHGAVWQRVLAQVVLSRSERAVWNSMAAPDEQLQWLLAQVALKDAVRTFVATEYGLVLHPSAVSRDERGNVVVAGRWADGIAALPRVAVVQHATLTLAVAGDARAMDHLHIDLIQSADVVDETAEPAFINANHLFTHMTDDERRHWSGRCGAAVRAVERARGRGDVYTVEHLDIARDELWLRIDASHTERTEHIVVKFTEVDASLVAICIAGRNAVYAA